MRFRQVCFSVLVHTLVSVFSCANFLLSMGRTPAAPIWDKAHWFGRFADKTVRLRTRTAISVVSPRPIEKDRLFGCIVFSNPSPARLVLILNGGLRFSGARYPSWFVTGFYGFTGPCGVSAVSYLAHSYMEVQRTDSLLVYEGLQRYRMRHNILAVVLLCTLPPMAAVAGISPYLYNITWRIYWVGLFLGGSYVCAVVIYAGTQRSATQQQPN